MALKLFLIPKCRRNLHSYNCFRIRRNAGRFIDSLFALVNHVMTQQADCHTRKLCYRKDDHATRAIQTDSEPLRRYGHSKLSKTAAAIPNLFESKIAPPDPPSPKNPTLEQNIKWIGSHVAEIWPLSQLTDR